MSLHSYVRLKASFGGLAKYTGRCFKKLVAPLFDLVGMHIELRSWNFIVRPKKL